MRTRTPSRTFVERVLSGPAAAKFLPAFLPFQQRVARVGLVNSLAQVVLKIASPGVPDFYQGTELWDLHLVDPDNRRPVDFDRRRQALADVHAIMALPCHQRTAAIADLLSRWPDGTIKMLLTACGLELRRATPDLFIQGEYVPLDVDVTVHADIVAFARVLDERARLRSPRVCVASDGRGPSSAGWRTLEDLARAPARRSRGRSFRDVFTGATVRPENGTNGSWIFAGQALQTLPVAVLVTAG